jgi:transcriptional regulator with XRE-family HTH domain
MSPTATKANAFGQRVRLARERRKLSLRELSDKAGVSFGHISDIETSKTDPSLTIVEKLEKVLGLGIRRNGARKKRAA